MLSSEWTSHSGSHWIAGCRAGCGQGRPAVPASPAATARRHSPVPPVGAAGASGGRSARRPPVRGTAVRDRGDRSLMGLRPWGLGDVAGATGGGAARPTGTSLRAPIADQSPHTGADADGAARLGDSRLRSLRPSRPAASAACRSDGSRRARTRVSSSPSATARAARARWVGGWPAAATRPAPRPARTAGASGTSMPYFGSGARSASAAPAAGVRMASRCADTIRWQRMSRGL